MSDYFEIRLDIAADTWTALEALLESLGAVAVTQSGGDTAVFGEPGVAAGDGWNRFVVEALFDGGCDAAAIATAIRRELGAATAITVRPVADRAWADAWKTAWQPLSFAGGLCVCPSWLEPPATARHVIRLDPGQAFGTGTHESTALCLDWLASMGSSGGLGLVVDYGTGSGVLALAASLFGARRVIAIDIDEDARVTAKDNVRSNGQADRIAVGDASLTDGIVADVLVANILAEPLLALAPRFAQLTCPGGAIALAGLLDSQAAAIEAAYDKDFVLAPAARRGEWVLLAGRRRSAAARAHRAGRLRPVNDEKRSGC
ncbi:MAG: 50S ribosomal protein L11 methyltransferase [Gammaproteobacteria bacterium]